MSATLRVKEFAGLAGVTVRTLQFYDRTGLLKPSGYTHNKHRLYQVEDLLRLQQVLTFKYLGYSLEQIRRLLDSAEYDVQEALKAQRKAILERIERLQKVASSLDRTIRASRSMKSAHELDWKLVRNVIAGIAAADNWEWVHSYYSPAETAWLRRRGKKVTPQQLAEWRRQWGELLVGFQQLMSRKRDPRDPAAQELAHRMIEMVRIFSGGHSGVEAALGRAYQDMVKLPENRRPFTPQLQQFMAAACAAYKKQND